MKGLFCAIQQWLAYELINFFQPISWKRNNIHIFRTILPSMCLTRQIYNSSYFNAQIHTIPASLKLFQIVEFFTFLCCANLFFFNGYLKLNLSNSRIQWHSKLHWESLALTGSQFNTVKEAPWVTINFKFDILNFYVTSRVNAKVAKKSLMCDIIFVQTQ